MIRQNIHIVNSKSLYEILDEAKSYYNFNLYYHEKKDFFLNKITDLNFVVLAIALSPDNLHNSDIRKKIIFLDKSLPLKFTELIEKININFIQQKYDFQSNFKIKDYNLNINSRAISKNNKEIKLTEKEIDIILFLNLNKGPQKVDVLQTKVWGYLSDLETHTVETHIYRLRKKIKNTFVDDNFILSTDNGYLIS